MAEEGPRLRNDWEALFRDWVEMGFSPSEFWGQTPRRLDLVFQARDEARRRQSDDLVSSEWRTAGFIGAAMVGQLPSLESVLQSTKPPTPKTAEQLKLAAFSWLGFPGKGDPD